MQIPYINGDGNLDPFGSKYIHYFLDSLVSPCLHLLDTLEASLFFRTSHLTLCNFIAIFHVYVMDLMFWYSEWIDSRSAYKTSLDVY